VKRFTNDLLKVLKTQPSKQIAIIDLPLTFEKSFSRAFKITDYGVRKTEPFNAAAPFLQFVFSLTTLKNLPKVPTLF
jgi:hypothetical protein